MALRSRVAALRRRLRHLEGKLGFGPRPVVVVLDAATSPGDREQILQRARESHPRARVVAITMRVKPRPAEAGEDVEEQHAKQRQGANSEMGGDGTERQAAVA